MDVQADLSLCWAHVHSAFSHIAVMFYISDEYWSNHPELHDVPIYYASSLAKKCMSVYQTYVNAMNEKIKKQISISNPFVFKHISNLKASIRSHVEDAVGLL